MFVQAGLNLRGHAICRARVSRRGSGRSGYATLWRFESGDVAWVSRTMVAWPHQVHVYGELYLCRDSKPCPPWAWDTCLLEERPEFAVA